MLLLMLMTTVYVSIDEMRKKTISLVADEA